MGVGLGFRGVGCMTSGVFVRGGTAWGRNAERLLEEVLKLPLLERVEVFERLGAQLEVERGQSLSDAWRDEISRRISRLAREHGAGRLSRSC